MDPLEKVLFNLSNSVKFELFRLNFNRQNKKVLLPSEQIFKKMYCYDTKFTSENITEIAQIFTTNNVMLFSHIPHSNSSIDVKELEFFKTYEKYDFNLVYDSDKDKNISFMTRQESHVVYLQKALIGWYFIEHTKKNPSTIKLGVNLDYLEKLGLELDGTEIPPKMNKTNRIYMAETHMETKDAENFAYELITNIAEGYGAPDLLDRNKYEIPNYFIYLESDLDNELDTRFGNEFGKE